MKKRDNPELNNDDDSIDFNLRKIVIRSMIDARLEDRSGLETLYHSLSWEERDVLDRIAANLSVDNIEEREKIARAILVSKVTTEEAIDAAYKSTLRFEKAFGEMLPEIISDTKISPPEQV